MLSPYVLVAARLEQLAVETALLDEQIREQPLSPTDVRTILPAADRLGGAVSALSSTLRDRA